MEPVKFVQANGLRFGYLEEGTGPLVLLVHGFPDTAYAWDRTLPVLAKAGFRAVAPFTRGYGPTEIPADGAYDTDTLGRDLLALIEALGEKQAIVVGHDWGAAASYAAAALGPDRVTKLVTLAIPHPRAIKPSPKMAWLGRHFITFRFPGAAGRLRARNFALLDQLVRRWSPGWDVPAGETAHAKESLREPGRAEAAIGYYRASSFKPHGGLAQKISVPTVTFASEDLPFELFEAARRAFTGPYEIVKSRGAHWFFRQHPDEFHAELLRVCRS